MKTNNILAGGLILAILATGLWFASADSEMFNWFKGKNKFERLELTDAEKIEIETMTDAEKKEFMETKKEAKHAEREAKEAVIDAHLAGQSLTVEQETLRAEIIKERAERKAQREEMKALKEEMKPIFEKKRNGEDLTDAEQAKLDEFKENHPGKGFKKGKKGNSKNDRWWHR